MWPDDAAAVLTGLARAAIAAKLGVAGPKDAGATRAAQATTGEPGSEVRSPRPDVGGETDSRDGESRAGRAITSDVDGASRLATGRDGASLAWLDVPGASFVTLTIDGDLRGCIGSLEAWRPLRDDVKSNAVSAAFRDPRFRPLSQAEFAQTAIEVSVLAKPEPMAFDSRDDLERQLRPGVDGLILSARGHRGTFLPQVWEQLPRPAEFVDHLLRKAGLPASYWGPDVAVSRYTVTAFHEAP